MKKRLYRSLSALLTITFIISGLKVPVRVAAQVDDSGLLLTEDEDDLTGFPEAVIYDETYIISEDTQAGEDITYIRDTREDAAGGDELSLSVDEVLSGGSDIPVSGNEVSPGEFLDENNTYQEIDIDIEESELGLTGEGISSKRRLRSVSAAELPSSFRTDSAFLPPVRNQNPYGTCWAFSSMASCEISLAKNYGLSADDLDLSERALAYFFYNIKGIDDPLKHTLEDYQTAILNTEPNIYQLGGNVMLASFFMANWGLPVDEAKAPYSDLVSCDNLTTDTVKGDDALDDKLCYDPSYHVQNVRFITKDDEEGIKRAIMENGIVARSFYSSSTYYNPATYAYNSAATHEGKTNHAISLVGWDDSFPKDSFGIEPDRDGAWLVRNSYGSGYGQDGYIWISYDDKSLNTAVMISCEPRDNYKYNYFYDGSSNASGYSGYNSQFYAANVFTASSDEVLRAVSVAMQSADTPYSVQIYRNLEDLNDPSSGTPMLEEEVKGTTSYQGIYTIPLNKEVKLNKGDTFSVVFHIESDDKKRVYTEKNYKYSFLDVHADIHPGQSFMRPESSSNWYDLAGNKACLRIHAFTDEDDFPSPDPYRHLYYVVTDGDKVVKRMPVRDINERLKVDKADGYRYYISCTAPGLSVDCIPDHEEVIKTGVPVTTDSLKRIELIPGEPGVTDLTLLAAGTDEKLKLSLDVDEASVQLSRSVFEFNSALDVRKDAVSIRINYIADIEEITLDGPEGFTVDYDFDSGSREGTLTLNNTEPLKTGTYSAVLSIKLAGVNKPILKEIKIRINNIKPVPVISTVKPVDLLYKPEHGQGELKISVNTGTITGIELADISKNGKTLGEANPLSYKAEELVIDTSGRGAILRIRSKSTNPRFNKAQLRIFIDGCSDPLKKDISIPYITSVLKPSTTGATVLTDSNGVLSGNEIELRINNNKYKNVEAFSNPVIVIRDNNGNSLDGRYIVRYDSGIFTIVPLAGTQLSGKGEEVNLSITDDVHLENYVVGRFKIKPLKIDKMSLALSKATIIAGYYEGETDINKGLEYETLLGIKGCGGLNDFIGNTVLISAGDTRTHTAITENRIRAVFDKTDRRIRVFFPDGSPEAGTYKFSLTLPASSTGSVKDIKTLLCVKVKKLDKAKAEKCKVKITGKLDVLNRRGTVTVTPAYNNLPSSYEVKDVSLTGADAGLFKLNTFSPDGRAVLSLLDNAVYNTGTKYKIGFDYVINTGGGSVNSSSPVYGISVIEGKCTIKADGVDLFGTTGSEQRELLDIRAYNSPGSLAEISDLILQNPNEDFSLVKNEDGYFINYKAGGAVKPGSVYTLKLKVILKDKAENTKSRSYNYKVMVAK